MTGLLPLGPFDPAWGEPLLLEVELEGSRVTGARLTAGLGHRVLELAMKGATTAEALHLVERTCARSAVAHGLAFCLAVEDASGTVVEEAPAAFRVVLAEYERIAAHLGAVSRLGRALEDDILYRGPRWFAALVADAFRLAFGNPFGFGAVVPGGARLSGETYAFEALPENFKVLERDCGLWEKKLALSKRRLSGAVLEEDWTGKETPPAPAFRASGDASDLRAGEAAYGFYGELDVAPVTRDGGSALDRSLVLLGEVRSSIVIVKRVLAGTGAAPGGPVSFEARKGSGVGCCESPHGAVEHRLFLGSGGKLISDRVSCAVEAVYEAVPGALPGTHYDDLIPAMVSFCLCAACIDR